MKTWHQCGLDATASKAKKHSTWRRQGRFSLANSIKPALEVDYAFIIMFVPSGREQKPKLSGKGMRNELWKLQRITQCLSVYACSIIVRRSHKSRRRFYAAIRDLASKEEKDTERSHEFYSRNFNFSKMPYEIHTVHFCSSLSTFTHTHTPVAEEPIPNKQACALINEGADE